MEPTETAFSLPVPRDAAEAGSPAMSPRIQSLLDRAVEDHTGERRRQAEALANIRGHLDLLVEQVAALARAGDERDRRADEHGKRLAAVESLTVELVEQVERRMNDRVEASLVAVVEALTTRGSAASLAPTEAAYAPDVDPLGPAS